MVRKEELRLGQRVLYGRKRIGALVDALTQDSCGLLLDGGAYRVTGYDEVWYEDSEDNGQV